MIGIAIALILALGVGGTAAVADNAKPGDALFGIDRAVENARISVAAKEKKDELRVKFAQERVAEIADITGVTESTVTEIEADAFTNETIVKIEYSDTNVTFTTTAKTKEAVIDAIIAKYPSLSKAFVEAKLSFETENRSSRAEERSFNEDDLSDDEKERVTVGIESALNLLAQLETQPANGDIAAITAALNAYLGDLPEDAEIRVSDNKLRIEMKDDEGGEVKIEQKENGKSKTEIRTDEGRIKIEVKDGEIEIKSKINDDEDDDSDDKDGLEEAEAKVFADKTVIEVEYNDQKTTFTTTATTRDAIVAAIAAKFPSLTTAQISAVLEIEQEDEDEDDDKDKGTDDDKDDDKDEDEDKDDDSSNSGSGN